MSDAKDAYSSAPKQYIEEPIPNSEINQERYRRAKQREAQWNDNWDKPMVGLVGIVNKFTPNNAEGEATMLFALFHNFDNVSYCGIIPNVPLESNEQVEIYSFDLALWPLIDKDFVDPVDNLCGTLLGNGGIDFFDVRQCRLLAGWLEARLEQPIEPHLAELYRKLDDFARRAVEYGTGVVVAF